MAQSKYGPSKDEIAALVKRAGLKLYTEGEGGIRIVAAGNSVYVGEFDQMGIQQRPGPKLQKFVDGLPPRFFSPSQTRSLVKPGQGSAGETQRKFTSIRARIKAIAADEKRSDKQKGSYLGFEVLDKKKKMPTNLVNASPGTVGSKTPRAITYIKKRAGLADDSFDLFRHIVISEAYIEGGKRVDEVHISYKLTDAESSVFRDAAFNEKTYVKNGGYRALSGPAGIEASRLIIGVHDPNLEFKGELSAAEHFKKTSNYSESLAKSLFGATSESYLSKVYDIPVLIPQDEVTMVVHDQVRTKEWIKLGEKGVSTATLGRNLEKVQKAIVKGETYRQLDEMTRTMVSMQIKLDAANGWTIIKSEDVLQGPYKGAELIKKAVDELKEKQGTNILQYIENITGKRRR